jgi:hypothetical protein
MPSIRQFLAASFFTCVALVAAASTSLAQTSNVQVVNPASAPVLTKIVNPASAPVPVSGTVKIGNDAGTPVQAKIVNAAASPVLVRVVDESARTPFQKSLSVTNSPDTSIYTVPTNKRLVIEFVSAHIKAPVDVKVTSITLTTQLASSSSPLTHFFVAYFQGTKQGGGIQQFTTDDYTASQQLRVFAGPGTQVKFGFDLSVLNPTFRIGGITISGYLEPVAEASSTSAPVSEAEAVEAGWESQNK